jgi:two-component system sensor histidine kinase AlgZ
MKTDAASEDARAYYLPDFCASRAALAIVLIVELTAFVLVLANPSPVGFWLDLARLSLFLIWIALAGAGLLCWSARWLKQLTPAQVSAAALAIIASVIGLL